VAVVNPLSVVLPVAVMTAKKMAINPQLMEPHPLQLLHQLMVLVPLPALVLVLLVLAHQHHLVMTNLLHRRVMHHPRKTRHERT